MKSNTARRKYFFQNFSWITFATLSLVVGIISEANAGKTVEKLIETTYSVGDPAFRQSMGHLVAPDFVKGNRVQVLLNGDEIFPAMLKAINAATNTITFENYIWESGEIGDAFKNALIERANAGVRIQSIADGMGTLKLKNSDIAKMTDAGIQFVKFKRDRWYKIKLNINHRTHRKLLIVDGKIGFIGGVCIADKWQGHGDVEDHWRDTHFRVEGPVVLQMQGVFCENWLETTSEVLQGPDYFPDVKEIGNCDVQCVKSGPQDGKENARLAHLLAIAAARKNIRLSHAYFVPDDLSLKQLLAARTRGVQIEIIVPLKNDSKVGRAASRSRWGALLNAGVKFYQYEPALYHCKVMIVDDNFVSAGSVNFDNRSFRINDEANINVLDKSFAAAQIKVFEEDKQKSLPLLAEQLRKRPWHIKLGDFFAGFLRSQL
ncbi:MAG: cardiolipin synthase [Verrucomicrobiota bacterium]